MKLMWSLGFLSFGDYTKKRIEFYVRHGLVKSVPTPRQLKIAGKFQYSQTAMPERIKYYLRNPLDIFPTKRKIIAIRQNNKIVACRKRKWSEIDSKEVEKLWTSYSSQNEDDTPKPPSHGKSSMRSFDRFLRYVFLFSPVRLSAHLIYNPWFIVPGTGLQVPLNYMVAHLAHGPHPFPLWDLQIIHADKGGLEWLERELDLREKGMNFKSRVYRALAQREGYYDYLRELIPRVRRFEYPSVPAGMNPICENLVEFLNHSLTL